MKTTIFIILFAAFLSPELSFSQTRSKTGSIGGTITDAGTHQAVADASINIKDLMIGTTTDSKGKFNLKTSVPFPFTIIVSGMGYVRQEITINQAADDMAITLSPMLTLMDEVVVAASRVEENIMQSPVTVEKMDLMAIRETPSMSFYQGLQSLKSLDVVTSGLTFTSVNTRGFGGIGTGRLLQLVDGG